MITRKVPNDSGPKQTARHGRQSAQHVVLADYLGDRFLVAEPVLEADGHGAPADQMLDRLGGVTAAVRLALEQHHIGRGDGGRVGGHRDLFGPVAAKADDFQAMAADRMDMLGIGVDQRHRQSTVL
jgi:hypothetical protein